MFRITPMVKNLLIINIGIALLQSITGISLDHFFALRVVFSDYFQPYQIFTYMWLHGGFRHIFGNMLILFFAGPMLENVWGSKRFLIFYLACGIGGGVLFGTADFIEKGQIVDQRDEFYADPNPEKFRIFVLDYANAANAQLDRFSDDYFENPDDQSLQNQARIFVDQVSSAYINVPMVGASGAIYGILMALLLLFPNTLIYIYFLFPIKVKYVVSALIIYEVWAELNRVPGDNIAHLAHLGGAAIAYILIRYWGTQNNRFY